MTTLYTAKTKCWKFETNIPRKGITGPQSQFPHSCVCERIIYSTMGLPFLLKEICGPILGIYKWLTDTWMWKLGLRPRYSQKRIYKRNCRCSVGCGMAQRVRHYSEGAAWLVGCGIARFRVRHGSVGSVLGCCKAAPSTNLGSASQWRPSNWADSDEEWMNVYVQYIMKKTNKEWLRATKPLIS